MHLSILSLAAVTSEDSTAGIIQRNLHIGMNIQVSELVALGS